MTMGFVLIIIITSYLNRLLKETLPEKWKRILKGLMWAAIALLVIESFIPKNHKITVWSGHAILLYILFILYKEQVFRTARPVLMAAAPYVLLSFITDIIEVVDKQFYSDWSTWLDVASIFTVIWMITMFFITNRQRKALEREKQKAKQEEEQNRVLAGLKADLEVQVAERTAELTRQKEELEHTLQDLRATQDQLIQSEKMASLGELTAGIAHEIQNPLNFVNNFSEVSTELIDEMNTEINNGNTEDAKLIANDLKQNLEKIIYHGKRADAIVKGMLQHSRKSTGQKELTDINELADEYLRLSYHGLRAKEKSFNASFKTDFDPNIGPINIVPQDIGRVLLNLINNAFYSVSEKQKQNIAGYQPTVSVSTKKEKDKIVIKIEDNGSGIPQNILDKIFQPFFTTKPTGQGTGLGLSLSYDIITKGHGGELKVESKEGEGAEFIILLPADK